MQISEVPYQYLVNQLRREMKLFIKKDPSGREKEIWIDCSRNQLIRHLEPKDSEVCNMFCCREVFDEEVACEGDEDEVKEFLRTYGWPKVNFDRRRIVGYSVRNIREEDYGTEESL